MQLTNILLPIFVFAAQAFANEVPHTLNAQDVEKALAGLNFCLPGCWPVPPVPNFCIIPGFHLVPGECSKCCIGNATSMTN